MDLALRLFVFIAVACLPCVVALWRPTNEKSLLTKRVLGAFSMLVTLFYNAYYLSPSRFKADVSLPLQVCDLLGFAAIFALIADWRFARVAIVLCVLPFVSQAVVTPVGEQHITSARTILYWTFHACIFAVFLFEIAVRGFRPSLRDFGRLCLLDIGYVIAISILDAEFGWNYGYIGNTKPGETTLVDFLGPWPFRVLIMTGLAIALQAICYTLFKDRERLT